MTENAYDTGTELTYPGQRLGLPEAGPGSLATWGQRATALVLDWAISTALAVLITWGAVLNGSGPERFATLVVFFLEKTVTTALTGSSIGQLIVGIGVTRANGTAIPWWVAVVRTFMICLVIPAAVIGDDRRSLNDMMLRALVVKRR
ncbi:RDD family protein [Raineyella antarctica]|uniref:RDD family protein n=1 Tax=Raineyella antarctica TaxID=1577474 RepID=A0A1G6GDN6_9ACTN|nr:RDD family protein [Raineyella antarctica]SDB80090.1 RDD family protein [Raineyella antarctica]